MQPRHACLDLLWRLLLSRSKGAPTGSAHALLPTCPSPAHPHPHPHPRPGTAESEVLVEEAFRLWTVTLGSLPCVPAPMRELLPNAAALLRRGRDAAALFPILEVRGGGGRAGAPPRGGRTSLFHCVVASSGGRCWQSHIPSSLLLCKGL